MSGLSNVEVGRVFGVSHATVSRWRSGERVPLILQMREIRSALTWSIDDQADAINDCKWHREFERKLGENEGLLRATLHPRVGSPEHNSAEAVRAALARGLTRGA